MKRVFSLLLVLALTLSLAACGDSSAKWQEQYDLGQKYLTEGNYEEAILAFTAAIEIDPKNPEAYLGLAYVYIAQDDFDSAEEILTRGYELTQSELLKQKLEELRSGNVADQQGRIKRASAYDASGALLWYHIYDYTLDGKQAAATAYDAAGNQTVRVEFQYDENGNVLYGYDGYSPDSGALRPAEYTYDTGGELIEKSVYQLDGSLEERVAYQWTADKTGCETLHYDSGNSLVESSTTLYNANGDPLELTWYSWDTGTKEFSQRGVYEYDGSRLLSISWYDSEDQFYGKWVYLYDDAGNEIGEEEYDGEGNLRQTTMY